MAFENLIVQNKGRIRYITINRESKLNALNKVTLAELHEALTQSFSDKAVGGIIITGSGPKAFVAGADIAEFATLNNAGGKALSKEGHSLVFDLIANGNKPVIAAVNGFA